MTTSAKFALVAISPLTGRICDALSSSHFALAAKRVGVDAIAITGRRAEPSIVFIEGNTDGSLRVIWQPAESLWGLPARQAEEHVRARHGADWQVAAIGPAGERVIPFATISHDGRHAGRGGLGAILGSKREGWTAGEDTLPSRLLTESPPRPGASFLSRSRLQAMIAAYYRERGWTEQGRFPEHLRGELRLEDPVFG